MQRLTFHRFLEKYVRALSLSNTNNVRKLARELSEQKNHRLREPLFLYALSTGKVNMLLNELSDYPDSYEYRKLAENYKWNDMVKALQEESVYIGRDYHKAYQSFQYRRNMPETNENKKKLMHKKIKHLQEKKGVSNYRLYTDLKLNPSNINSFLKYCDTKKVSLDVARSMVTYLEAA